MTAVVLASKGRRVKVAGLGRLRGCDVGKLLGYICRLMVLHTDEDRRAWAREVLAAFPATETMPGRLTVAIAEDVRKRG